MATEVIAQQDQDAEEIVNDLQDIVLDVQSRHRREKKELQAKIQALKKNVPKGNKKLRKEVMEEIARLENEMSVRHAQELIEEKERERKTQEEKSNERLSSNCNAAVESNASNESRKNGNLEGEETEDGVNEGPVRISKAQKRREKKAKENREREERYAAALEEMDMNGPKVVEERKLQVKLKERQLKLHPVCSDGDCLYNAVLHQYLLKNQHRIPSDSMSVLKLREMTADYIELNKDTLLPYMTHPDTGNLLTDEEFLSYCEEVRHTSAWGGHIELKALSTVLKTPIEVIQADGAPTIQGQEYDEEPLVITYHRHLYSLGEHYNSTMPRLG